MIRVRQPRLRTIYYPSRPGVRAAYEAPFAARRRAELLAKDIDFDGWGEPVLTPRDEPFAHLVGSSRGLLRQGAEGQPTLDVSTEYLQEQEFPFSGLENELTLERRRHMTWVEGIEQITYRQTNSRGIPLYGSAIVCNLLGNNLTLVNSNLHPAPLEVIDNLEWRWPEEPANDRKWRALVQGRPLPRLPLEELELFVDNIDKPLALEREARRNEWPADRWILPYLPDEITDSADAYRPVWRILFVDQYHRRWLALLDGRDGATVTVRPAWAAATRAVHLFPTALSALNGWLRPRTLNYGNSPTLQGATDVRIVYLNEPHYEEPDDTVNIPNMDYSGDQMVRKKLLKANAYYRVRQVQAYASNNLMSGVTRREHAVEVPSPMDEIKIVFDPAMLQPIYQPEGGQHAIRLPGDQLGGTPIFEPGFDPEVLCHEFIHAFLRWLNYDFFQTTENDFGAPQVAAAGMFAAANVEQLDEAIAFYLACAQNDNPAWSEYSYQAWAQWRNLSQPAPLAPDGTVVPDPAGARYSGGMEWARSFWKLRTDPVNGLGELSWNRILLQGFGSLSGPFINPQEFVSKLSDPTFATAQQIQKINSVL
jgi:hypothetical protein